MNHRLRDLFFKLRYGFRGYPAALGDRRFRVDESLRRWNFSAEEEVREVIASELAPGSTAIDIGANFGLHSLVMADAVAREGQVFSYEPIPANLGLLKRNVALNGFQDRITVREVALSDSPEKYLTMVADADGLEPSASISFAANPRAIRVPNSSLDAELGQFPKDRPCFIKLDVEGAELSVLRSGESLLRTLKPTLLIEVHTYALPTFGASSEMVHSFLASRGYVIERLSSHESQNGSYYHVLAKPGNLSA